MTSIGVRVDRVGVERDRGRDGPRPAPRAEDVSLVSRGGGVSGSGSFQLVQIVAMVKPFRAQAVLAALESVEILGGTVREAMGYGRQKNRLHRYLGSEYNASFLPKVEITLVVAAHDLPAAIKAIVGQARTGRMGDGKILILPCYPEHLDL